MSTGLVRRHRRPLAVAVLVALLAPGMALAETAKEKELEARVAQLEAQVQALLNAQQQTQTQIADTKTQLDQVKASQPAAVPQGKQPIQSTTILTAGNPNSTFSYGGFIKFDAMATDTSDGKIADGSSGRLFYVPSTIPVVADGTEPNVDPYTDFHAQFSRFWLSADHLTANGDKLKAYVEMDFFGGGNAFFTGTAANPLVGNETSTNTYAVSLRQAYVSWNNWLAGQTWSNFQDTAALPDAVDFVGTTDGTIFVRQAQVRYTKGAWSFSAENPQTTVTPYQSLTPRFNSGDNTMPDLTARWLKKGDWGHFTVAGMVRQAQVRYTKGAWSFSAENPQTTVTPYRSLTPRFNSGDNTMPDLTARWLKKGDWGHFTVAGMVRQFKYLDETATGGAVSVSGKFNLGKNDDLRYMVNAGSGIGRYMAFGLGSDTVLDASGELEPLDGYGAFVAWRHVFSPKLRGNLMYSAAHFDNDADITGFGVTERAQSYHANLIYSPFPKLDVGAELSWGQRSLEDDREGDLTRVHTSVKYSF